MLYRLSQPHQKMNCWMCHNRKVKQLGRCKHYQETRCIECGQENNHDRSTPRGLGVSHSPGDDGRRRNRRILLRKLVALSRLGNFAVLEIFQGFFEHHFRASVLRNRPGLYRTPCRLPVDRLHRRCCSEGKRDCFYFDARPNLRRNGRRWFRLCGDQDWQRRSLWRLTWYFSDSLVIVIAGALVQNP